MPRGQVNGLDFRVHSGSYLTPIPLRRYQTPNAGRTTGRINGSHQLPAGKAALTNCSSIVYAIPQAASNAQGGRGVRSARGRIAHVGDAASVAVCYIPPAAYPNLHSPRRDVKPFQHRACSWSQFKPSCRLQRLMTDDWKDQTRNTDVTEDPNATVKAGDLHQDSDRERQERN